MLTRMILEEEDMKIQKLLDMQEQDSHAEL